MAANKALAVGCVLLALLGAALWAAADATAGDLDQCRDGEGEAQIAACAAVGADSTLPTAIRTESLLRHSLLVRKTGDDALARFGPPEVVAALREKVGRTGDA